MSTQGSSNPYPWDAFPPFMQYLPFPLSDAPSFFKVDILHVYHLGVGRDFAASSLVYILTNHYEGTSVAENIEAMNNDLKVFLRTTKRQLHFRNLSKQMLGFTSSSTYPSGHWSKGMDTPVMIYFVEWLLNKFGGASRIDLLLKDACRAIHLCWTTMLPASLFAVFKSVWQNVIPFLERGWLFVQLSTQASHVPPFEFECLTTIGGGCTEHSESVILLDFSR